MKRGMLEVQFNWIFIIIAGAVILAFFFSIIQKQRSVSEEKLSLALINELDAITTGAASSKGSAQRIDLPRTGIDFGCSDECACAFRVGSLSRDYRDKIIFSPNHIEGKDIVFWTLPWNVPFRAGNFLYVTNDRIKYFFVSDSSTPSLQLKAQLQQELPDKINAEFIEPSQICSSDAGCVKNENYQQVKFVFLETTPSVTTFHESFKDTDITGVHLSGSQATFFKCYPQRTGDCEQSGALSYIGDAGLFATIFAYDDNMYRCNMQEAVKRLSYVAQVMENRAIVLQANGDLLRCGYSTTNLEVLRSGAAAQVDALADLGSLTVAAQSIAGENEALLRQSCPTIY